MIKEDLNKEYQDFDKFVRRNDTYNFFLRKAKLSSGRLFKVQIETMCNVAVDAISEYLLKKYK